MRRTLVTVLALGTLVVAPAGYIAYPLVTAWSIREAVRNGDSAYLAQKIDFPSVRETLRGSMHRVALDMPDPATTTGAPSPTPGVWTRVKSYLGRAAVNRFVNTHITPEGLPRLYEYRQAYRTNISGEVDERTLPRRQRIKRFWKRLVRAEFKSLTAFEVELLDRYDPTRRHIGLLEFERFEWRLTELRIKTSEPVPAVTAAKLPPAH